MSFTAPPKLDIEPGGEWLLPAAKRWLEQAKKAMRTPLGAKVFDLPTGEKVTVNWRPEQEYIRISGGKVWYPVGVALPNPRPYSATPTVLDSVVSTFSGTGCGGGWPSIVRRTRIYSDGSSCGCEGELHESSTYCSVGSSGAWTDVYTGYPVIHLFTTEGYPGWPGHTYRGPPAFASGGTVITVTDGYVSGSAMGVSFPHDTYYLGLLATLTVLSVPWETAEETTARGVALYLGAGESEVTAMGSGAYSVPAVWEYELKRKAPRSLNTYRANKIISTTTDVVVSDSSTNLTTAGIKITRRIAKLLYVTKVGEVDETKVVQIDGTLIQTVTEHYIGTVLQSRTRRDQYSDWYTGDATGASLPPSLVGTSSRLRHKRLLDNSLAGFGLVWDGEWTAVGAYFSDSLFGVPKTGYPGVTWSPPQPAYSNTLTGTVPEFISQYMADEPVQYDETGALAATAWNDSAMEGVTTLSAIVFSPVKDGMSLGMFGTNTDKVGAVEFKLEGKAVFAYSHKTGDMIFKKFIPRDPEVQSVFRLPDGVVFPTYNSVVLYEGALWKDVIAGAKQLKESLTLGAADQFMAAVLTAAGDL